MDDQPRPLASGSSRSPGVVLGITTIAFTVCFACWVLNSVLATYLASKGVVRLTDAQVGWLLAVPILSGAFSRVPLGILTDRFGGRDVFSGLLIVVAASLLGLSFTGTFASLLMASLAVGLAGGSFAVGVGFLPLWFEKGRQGTALGIFGAGNAGAALTAMVAPLLLKWLTAGEAGSEGWRWLPRCYAVVVLATMVAFRLLTADRRPAGGSATIAQQLAPLKSVVVWRFGLYYLLVFGSFVALAQWLLPYCVNVYQLSLVQAGLLTAVFSLPSGLVRALGGWLSDRYGARNVMYWVFWSCILSCAVLSIPRMTIESSGEGVSAAAPGVVGATSPERVTVGERTYALRPPPASLPGQDADDRFLPVVTKWHEPVVAEGAKVEKKQLLARGLTRILYPANLWLFVAMVFVYGLATGVGKAAVFKFIPDKFPNAVGAVGGVVGLIGGVGGFIFPPVWAWLLSTTGLWASTWWVLAVLSVICLVWMISVVHDIVKGEAPQLSRLMEYSQAIFLQRGAPPRPVQAGTIEDALRQVPFFSALTPEEVAAVARIGTRRRAEAGELLFREGDPGDHLYVVLEGEVAVRREEPDGPGPNMAHFGPGRYFGELALIDGAPRSASAQAVTTSELFLLPRQEFFRLIGASPHLLADVLVGLTGKVRDLIEQGGAALPAGGLPTAPRGTGE